MTEPLLDLLIIVKALNDEYFRVTKSGQLPFELCSNGDEQGVFFFDQPLWNSEEDERRFRFTGKENELEPIDDYLRKQADNFARLFLKVKFTKIPRKKKSKKKAITHGTSKGS